jgi:hypothetical protein
VTKTFKKKEKS